MDVVKFEDMPALPVTQEAFNEEVSSGEFLPRLQVADTNSKICKRKQVEAGNWGLVRNEDDVVDLSNQVDILIIHMRWTALDTNGEKPIFSHEKESDTFKTIADNSTVKDSGCLWGPEFLVYIPTAKTFATYFCCSITARREAKNIFKLMHKAATFKTHFIETKKYSWYGPLVVECSTPLETPPMEEIKKQALKFASAESEEVAEDDKRDR